MARDVSLTARQALFDQETSEVFLPLLTISHTDMTTLRFVNNNEDVTSNGNTFSAFSFDIALPSEEDDGSISQVEIKIDNVDRKIVQSIRDISSAPDVQLDIVLASDPDTAEAGPFNFTLQQARYDAITVTGTLGYPSVLDEPYPGDVLTPQNHPAAF